MNFYAKKLRKHQKRSQCIEIAHKREHVSLFPFVFSLFYAQCKHPMKQLQFYSFFASFA